MIFPVQSGDTLNEWCLEDFSEYFIVDTIKQKAEWGELRRVLIVDGDYSYFEGVGSDGGLFQAPRYPNNIIYRLIQFCIGDQYNCPNTIVQTPSVIRQTITIKSYPNPFSNQLKLEVIPVSSFNQKVKFEIWNNLGQLVEAGVFPNGHYRINLTTEHWQMGTYFIRILIGEWAAARKIVLKTE